MLQVLTYCKLLNPSSVLTRTMDSNKLKIVRLEQKVARAELAIQNLLAEVEGIKTEIHALKSGQATPIIKAESINKLVDVGPLVQKRLLQCNSGVGVLEKVKKAKLSFDKDGDYIVVYTDGACPNNGKGGAKAGIGVWFGENHPLNVGKPCPGNRQTNNAAEILACAEACKIAEMNDLAKIQINTDSKFVIDCVTKWMPNWKRNNWKTAAGKDVINKEELLILEKNANILNDVKYKHVNGHAGIQGNEGADQLAVKGAYM
ncbi:ribonuclease H1 [Atheta coriaria]|uniref:ribonuclease H1 n=1 Tax=Dalotia coriaria TaxID=877792 RepID=UPI0031F39994